MINDTTALLIVRVAIDGALPLRIHVRHTADVSAGFEGPFDLADADAAVELVRAWLLGIQRPSGV
jgi:hypothetical protein